MAKLEPKTPDDVRNYKLDWADYLGDDTIATSTVTVEDVTLDNDTNDTTSVTITVSGGVNGTVATITNTITTSAGLTETEVFTLQIEEVEEPLSLAEAKDQVRVVDTSEDAYIESLISAARRYVENRSGVIVKRRQFIERHMPVFGAMRLYSGPIVSIDTVAYTDSDKNDATYVGARFFPGSSIIFPALGELWPTPYLGEHFMITYTAGLSPQQLGTDDYTNLIHAMKLLIGHWFVNREAVLLERAQALVVPLAVDDLCDQVRALVV
jgi:uncharacterized phiE125 gp8 family phage protein